jgi:hypothetical protein
MTKENETMNTNETEQEINRESEKSAPSLQLLEKPPRFFADIARALLIILALVVAAGFILLVLPKPAADKLTQDLRARAAKTAPPASIAFLFLKDRIENNNFHIAGVVRNISSAPVQNLEAAVRLYLHDETVYETTIVPMDKAIIQPDGTAQFDLIYPNYKMQFQRYSVEFKLKNGDLVNYKDMRPADDAKQPAGNAP